MGVPKRCDWTALIKVIHGASQQEMAACQMHRDQPSHHHFSLQVMLIAPCLNEKAPIAGQPFVNDTARANPDPFASNASNEGHAR